CRPNLPCERGAGNRACRDTPFTYSEQLKMTGSFASVSACRTPKTVNGVSTLNLIAFGLEPALLAAAFHRCRRPPPNKKTISHKGIDTTILPAQRVNRDIRT